jgi:hypothetical protein
MIQAPGAYPRVEHLKIAVFVVVSQVGLEKHTSLVQNPQITKSIIFYLTGPAPEGEARSLPKSRAPEKCFYRLGSCLTRKH